MTGQDNLTRLLKGAMMVKRQILGYLPSVVLLKSVIVPGATVASPSRHTIYIKETTRCNRQNVSFMLQL